ncbi:MAG: hypothetical protein J7518_11210 [Nocardioidaceae bacterium]|nr:hypothetical protein [Nocardioidaceae bacterium]
MAGEEHEEEHEDGYVQALLRCLFDHERDAAAIPHIVVCRADVRRGEVYFGPFRDRGAAESAAALLDCSGRHSARLHQPVPLLPPGLTA